jgi:prevent-host-death family protein
MSAIVNMHQAKTQLSKLVELARLGEEVVIARDGLPVARIVPFAPPKGKRHLGLLAGKIRIGDDFNDPLPDEYVDSST